MRVSTKKSMKTALELFTKYKFLLVAILLGALSVVSLFQPGLPPTHDGEYHVVRFYEFYNTLRSGSWYPVWATHFNYGYGLPFFTYVYPLPNYVASAFHLLGASFIDSFKLNLIAAAIIGSITSFYLGKRRFGDWGGLLTSAFYTYAPYHFLDIYIRGSVGEVWALALFPLPLILVDRIIEKQTLRNVVYFALSFALLIFSHNILSLMYFVFLLSYCLVALIRQKYIKRKTLFIFCAFFLAFALAAVFFIPALLEKQYVVGLNTFNYEDHFPELFQLLIPSWGSGYSGISSGTQMSFQVGLVNLLIIGVVALGLIRKKFKKNNIYTLFFWVWFFISFFLITSYSQFIWELIKPMELFQFPWRILSIVIFCCAVLAGSITNIFKNRIVYISFILLLIITTYSYAKPPYMLVRSDSYYTNNPNFIYATNSIGNGFNTKWLSRQTSLATFSAELSREGTIQEIMLSPTRKEFLLDVNERQTILFNTAYFPGWTAYSNGKELDVAEKNGKIMVTLDGSEKELELVFKDTPIRLVSKFISISAFIFIIIVLLKSTVIQLIHDYRNR